jgi:hypothetical protein
MLLFSWDILVNQLIIDPSSHYSTRIAGLSDGKA